ncbi:hypothetical protein KI387_015314, partial [Taxus chinensis]
SRNGRKSSSSQKKEIEMNFCAHCQRNVYWVENCWKMHPSCHQSNDKPKMEWRHIAKEKNVSNRPPVDNSTQDQ